MAWADVLPTGGESGWVQSEDGGATAEGHLAETAARAGFTELGVLDTELRGLLSYNVMELAILTITAARLTLEGITGYGDQEAYGYRMGVELIDYAVAGGVLTDPAGAWGGAAKATLATSTPINPRPIGLTWTLTAPQVAVLLNAARTRIGMRLRDYTTGLSADCYWLPSVARATLRLTYGMATAPRLELESERALRRELDSERELRRELESERALRRELESGWLPDLPTREG